MRQVPLLRHVQQRVNHLIRVIHRANLRQLALLDEMEQVVFVGKLEDDVRAFHCVHVAVQIVHVLLREQSRILLLALFSGAVHGSARCSAVGHQHIANTLQVSSTLHYEEQLV